MKIKLFLSILVCTLLFSCNNKEKPAPQKVKRIQPKNVSYSFANGKDWLSANSTDNEKLNIAFIINRTDKNNFSKLDTVVVPNDFSGDKLYYQPFPFQVDYLKDIKKIIYFSYATQTFATYENGELTYAGPTNMGRKKDPTPTGLFFTNWKAEKTTSTVNDEWELKWNFNIANKLGVGWHQYEMPGYPASHSCLRLLEEDAKYLYKWADEWVLSDNENVAVKGTPVIIFGNYNFDGPKPWFQLVTNPKALDISVSEIEEVTVAHLNTILNDQNKS
ncbi:MAG: L,D-transpeptidase [Bacteroidota bacterium]